MNKSELIQRISEANTAYAAGIPFMTDYEYDQLWQALHHIDPTNDLLYHTAKNTLTGGHLVTHKYPIFGTNKAFNMIDLKPFLTRFGDQKLVIEPKYDGCAAVLTLTKDGYILTAEGDGKQGEDKTHLLPHINIYFQPRHFQAIELIIPWSEWNPDYGKNPRNVVAGWIARKHEKPPINMTAIPHNFGPLSEEYQYSGDLEQFGEHLLKIFTSWAEIYPMDGLMIKVADEKARLIASNNGQTNNWSIAWKPPIQTKTTTVTDIEWNISRLGRIIPTVIYEPIELCLTTNSRVTGNNAQWLKARQIQIGSTLLVGKAGEIIPKIIEVNNNQQKNPLNGAKTTASTGADKPATPRTEFLGSILPQNGNGPQNGAKPPLPAYCPKCGEPLKWEGVHLICTGSNCVAKLIVSIAYFYSHRGIKIDGIGEATVEKLLEEQKIFEVLSTKPWALLDPLTYNISIETYSILGEKIFTNIIKQVNQASGTKTAAHFISGLGLPGLGYKTSLRLCQYLKSGNLNIPISNKAKKSFFDAAVLFNDAKVELKNFSFAALPEAAKAIYCITGTLSQSRESMIEFLSSYGYEFSSSVTRETNYLIKGQDPGKVKIEKATKHKIPIITEEQFFKLLEKEK
ncbi:MAG: BRCT domain-containing protein [Thermotogota bacterium]|nr:BRCT domain-containing protein [Thermotogota bacterium]